MRSLFQLLHTSYVGQFQMFFTLMLTSNSKVKMCIWFSIYPDRRCIQSTMWYLNWCRCQDYLLIDRGDFGTTEICGNKTPNSSLLQLESHSFKVFFRTSEQNRYPGFEMYVICFKEEERDLPGIISCAIFGAFHDLFLSIATTIKTFALTLIWFNLL